MRIEEGGGVEAKSRTFFRSLQSNVKVSGAVLVGHDDVVIAHHSMVCVKGSGGVLV